VCDANPADAEAIAKSAGMAIRKPNISQKAALTAKATKISGTVALVALAIAGAGSYEWQMSQDEKTWTNLPPTKGAKASVPGLTVGASYYFRVRGVTSQGPTNWTQIVTLVVT
jgi:hypothetical protein